MACLGGASASKTANSPVVRLKAVADFTSVLVLRFNSQIPKLMVKSSAAGAPGMSR